MAQKILSVIDIIKSLTLLIESHFPAYPVNDRDLDEGFSRPSYFIDIDEIRGSSQTTEYVKEESDLQIYFFAEDRYQGFLDLIDVKNKLLALLSVPLPLTDENNQIVAHVTFDETPGKNLSITINKADKTLLCTLTSVLVQQLPDESDPGYYMENLDFHLWKNDDFNQYVLPFALVVEDDLVYQTVEKAEDIPPELIIDGFENLYARLANRYDHSNVKFSYENGAIYMEYEDEAV